ncbi:MAG: hypothetical protein G8345_20270 [Magnetococcales bacterium]|nr:hypothetical protein [Magnetococcales bacterium]
MVVGRAHVTWMLLLLVWLLGGCSTIMNGLEQTITVTAEERDELTCTFSRDGKEWSIEEIPGTLSVRKSSKPIDLKCEKKGFEPYHTTLKPVYDGYAREDVLLGMGVTLVWVAVDEAMAGHWSYPSHVDVVLKPMVVSKTRKSYLRRKRKQGQEDGAPPPEEETKNIPVFNDHRRMSWYEMMDDPDIITKSLSKALPPAMRAPTR